MAAPSTTYEPRCPAQTALYQIVRDHFETFRVRAACLRDGEGLPQFVEQEFRNFLRCDGGVADGRGGAVAVIQRFGGALNLNVHVHALVLDRVFAKDGFGVVRFRPLPSLTGLDVAEVLATVEPRIKRLLIGGDLGTATRGRRAGRVGGRSTGACQFGRGVRAGDRGAGT